MDKPSTEAENENPLPENPLPAQPVAHEGPDGDEPQRQTQEPHEGTEEQNEKQGPTGARISQTGEDASRISHNQTSTTHVSSGGDTLGSLEHHTDARGRRKNSATSSAFTDNVALLTDYVSAATGVSNYVLETFMFTINAAVFMIPFVAFMVHLKMAVANAAYLTDAVSDSDTTTLADDVDTTPADNSGFLLSEQHQMSVTTSAATSTVTPVTSAAATTAFSTTAPQEQSYPPVFFKWNQVLAAPSKRSYWVQISNVAHSLTDAPCFMLLPALLASSLYSDGSGRAMRQLYPKTFWAFVVPGCVLHASQRLLKYYSNYLELLA